MSTTPFVGLDTVVTFGAGSPPTTLDGVTGVTFSGDKVATEKTTTMQTPNGTDTFIGSTDDPGTCDIKCWKYPGNTSQEAMESARVAKLAIPFSVILPGARGTRTFSGIIESATLALPLEKNATVDYKVKLSGPWTDTF